MNDPEVERFRRTAQALQQAVRHPAVDGFPTLAPIARSIEAVLNSIDLDRLHAVPTRTLAQLTTLTAQAADHVQFTIDSHPLEDALRHGVSLAQDRPNT
jgi:hypothetical protein